ncbi:MAG: hypothetical protein GEV10_30930 [Streptosporangiales bacterium]|nr:hypothetical protein [Streptosporangiales bacterium]
MQIQPQVAGTTRVLLGYAVRGEHEEFERALRELDNDALEQAVALSMSVSGAVAVHVCQANPPSEDALRTLATTIEKKHALDAEEVFTYLSRCIFGSSGLAEVFETHDAVRLPFRIAGTVLDSYAKAERGQTWTDYLDEVEAAIEAAPDPQ